MPPPDASRVSPRLRTAVRAAALGVAVVLASGVAPCPDAVATLPALSPFVAAASLLAARTATTVTLLALPVLVLALIRRRWFCRWACPTGFLAENAGRLRRGGGAGGWPRLGLWVALGTLGGAAIGYPVLLWMDPLTIFSGLLGAWRTPVTAASVAAALGLPLVLLVSLLWPGAWCGRLCPLGAIQDLLAEPRRWWHARREGPRADVPPPAGPRLGRRAVAAACVGGAIALATAPVRGKAAVVRPPGALDEARFLGLCARCGACARVCPSGILRPDLGRAGVAGLLAPAADFDTDFCRADCNACCRACPSGAIARLPLEAKRRAKMGLARIDLGECLLPAGRECSSCFAACPYDALERVESPDGFVSMPRVIEDRCTGCGACESACPVRPKRAARVFAPGEAVPGPATGT